MSVRDQNLQTVGFLTATFKVHQTAGEDDLKDVDVGKAVTITGDYEIGPGSNGDILIGKLIHLSLTDADVGKRVATVQIGGICTLPTVATIPSVGDGVVVDGAGAVKQAPALGSYDPAGGNVARGTVVEVSGSSEVTLILG
jgi:predicted RecA/RadA family phage recombinase